MILCFRSVLNTTPSPLKVQQQPSSKATTGEIISSTPNKTNEDDRNVNLAKTQPINGVVSTISNLSKFDAVSTEPQQINESLSVSTTNKSDSLQVNVHYERKLCNISRKKCSGIHIKSGDKLSKNLQINSGVMNENAASSDGDCEKGNPANQLAYYQKLLEVRSRSSGNNNKLSITITSDNNNENVRTDDDSDEDCVLMDCTFSCSLCSFTTDKKKSLTEHERNHRRTNHAIFRCIYCNQKYTKYALYTHVQNVHPGQKFHISEEISVEKESAISATTSTSSLSNTTITNMNGSVKAMKKDGIWKCVSCSYTTSYMRDMKKHELRHLNGVPLVQCEFCSYISTSNAVRAHKRVHLNETPQLSKSLTQSSRRPEPTSNRPASLGTIPVREDSPPLLQVVHEVETKEKPKPKVKCIECSFYARNAEELAEHLKQHSIESVMDIKLPTPVVKTRPKMLECKHCSYVTNYTSNLMRHLNTHKTGKVIEKCPNCNYQSTGAALKVHQKSCQGIIQKPAPIVFKTKAKTFACTECAYSTTLQIKLNKHMKKKHPKPDKVLRCSQCDHTTKNPHHLEQHMKGHKSRMPTFKCSTCDFTGNMFALRHHFMTTGHSMEGRTPLQPPRLTPITKKDDDQVIEVGAPAPLINDSPPHLEMMVNNNKDVWEKCPKCSYQTHLKVQLKLHMRFHRGQQALVECPCGYKTLPRCMGTHQRKCTPKPAVARTPRKSVTETEFVLSSHEELRRTRSSSAKIETSKKPASKIGKPQPERLVKCSKCNFKSSKEMMRAHLKSEECQSETFRQTNQWKEDFRLFFPECDFQCDVCYVPFKTQFALDRHMPTHQNPENLKSCVVCGVKSSGNGLTVHRKVHTAKKIEKEPDNFQCESCPFSSPLRIKLNVHKRKRHSDHDDSAEPATKKAKPNPPSSVDESLKCTLCSYTASIPPSVKRHMHFHESNPTWQCPYCKYKGTLYMLKSHPCTKPKNEKRDPPIKVTLSCSKCSFTTYTHGELRAHEDTCTKEMKLLKNMNAVKSFKCEYCSFTSFWQYLIDRHKQSHEVLNLPIEQCPNCDFKSTPTALSAHLRNCNPLS